MDNPILKMITSKKIISRIYTHAKHAVYSNCYAVVYRTKIDISSYKVREHLKTIVFDKQNNLLNQHDYFEIIQSVSDIESTSKNVDYELLTNTATAIISKLVDNLRDEEISKQNRLLDIKIESISSYYNKKISKTIEIKAKSNQSDLIRMRSGEIDNLSQELNNKKLELNQRRNIKSSFEILGILEFI